MIEKYSPIIINQGFKSVNSVMIKDAKGDYIKYSDFVNQTERLRDYNFRLQDQATELAQQIMYLKQEKEILKTRLHAQEVELTAVSDKLNKSYVPNFIVKETYLSPEMQEYLRLRYKGT